MSRCGFSSSTTRMVFRGICSASLHPVATAGGSDNCPPATAGGSDNYPPATAGGSDNCPPATAGGSDNYPPATAGGSDNYPPATTGGPDRGSVIVKVVPSPTFDFTQIVP